MSASPTPDPVWTLVDHYIEDRLIEQDAALVAALEDTTSAGMPSIQVSAAQGKLLHLLARIAGARRILEIGTLGAYSTIWLARALPAGGRLTTIEVDPNHAQVASANLTRAGVKDVVDLLVGRALDVLPGLEPHFDFVFIDADKPNSADYFAHAVRLARPGTVIVVDNVVRRGAVADEASEDQNVQGIQRFFDRVAAEPRVSATAIQTVGVKGHDGLAIVRVND